VYPAAQLFETVSVHTLREGERECMYCVGVLLSYPCVFIEDSRAVYQNMHTHIPHVW